MSSKEKLKEISEQMERLDAAMEVLKAKKEALEAAEAVEEVFENPKHPMLGKRCIIRTYSAGVHIGTVSYVNPSNSMEVKLTDAIRLWKWENGGLSLSAIANNGMKGGRCNYTGEVYLTNVIEYIPTTAKAEESFKKYIEDKE